MLKGLMAQKIRNKYIAYYRVYDLYNNLCNSYTFCFLLLIFTRERRLMLENGVR